MILYDLQYLAFIRLTFATDEALNTRMIKTIITKYLEENDLGKYYLEHYRQDEVSIKERDIHLDEKYSNIDNLFPSIIYVYAHTECEICTFKEYWNKYMDHVDIKEIRLLHKDEFLRHKDSIRVFDWFWLGDDAVIEEEECWKYLGPKLDENGNQTRDQFGYLEYNYDVDGEKEIRPLPNAYIVDDHTQEIYTESITRGDISLRYAMIFNSNKSLKPGTKLLYGSANNIIPFVVLEDGLAFSEYVCGDTWWGDFDCHVDDINECSKWSNSEVKKRCDSYFNKNGTIAIVVEDV